MRTPTAAERNWAYEIIEKNCKSKGKYLKSEVQDLNKFVEKVKNVYPAYNVSVKNCFESTKNVLKEIVKWIQAEQKVDNKLKLVWFKSFINMVIACIRAGLNFALGWINRFLRNATESLPSGFLYALGTMTAVTFVTSSLILGIVSAVLIIGMTIWRQMAEDIDYEIRKNPSIWQRIKEKISDWLNLGNDDEIPEELLPPEPKAPNIMATRIGENMEIAAGILFVIILKAIIAARLNEELQQKINILKPLLTPTGALLGLLTTLLLLGSGGASAII